VARQRMIQRRSRTPNRGWASVETAGLVAVAGATKILLGGFVPLTGDVTVLRSVGILSVGSDQQVAGEHQQGAFGMCVVNNTAFALGVTAIPGPFTDSDSDLWFVHQYYAQELRFGTAVGMEPNWATKYEFDSRGKRVVNEDQTVAIMIENPAGAFGISIQMGVRMLAMVRGT